MLRKADEAHHNTDEQVRGYIGKAIALMDELDVPAELRPTLAAEAVRLYGAKQVTYEQTQLGMPHLAIPRG